jgi:hypothetical protein
VLNKAAEESREDFFILTHCTARAASCSREETKMIHLMHSMQ